MKKLIRFVMEWKTWACYMFTGTMSLYLVIWLSLGEHLVPVSTLWSFLLVSALGTLLQCLCFTELVIRRMRYTGRLTLFGLLFLPVLSVIAWAFQWFPGELGEWLTFLGIFLVVFVVITLGFELKSWADGRKFDGLLGQYRREKERREE